MGTSLDNTVSAENEGNKQKHKIVFHSLNLYITGIVPRCIIELFQLLKKREAQDAEFKYEIFVSFLELYNEEFIDLLNNHKSKRRSANFTPATSEVSIREDVAGNIYWSGVKEEICYSPEELLKYIYIYLEKTTSPF